MLKDNKISLLREEKDWIAIYKPVGILMHETKISSKPIRSKQNKVMRETEPTVVEWLLENYPEVKNVGDDPTTRPGIVHRLDKETSGVVIVPRNQKFFEYLKKLFQTHQAQKTYLALVWGELDENKGIVDRKIYLKPGTTKRSVFGGKMGKDAITEYEVINTWSISVKGGKKQSFSLVKVMPKTGRTHQIRVHLSSLSHPIIGDPLYGKKKDPFGLKHQALHAESIEFPLPNGKKVSVSASIPAYFKAIIDELKRKG